MSSAASNFEVPDIDIVESLWCVNGAPLVRRAATTNGITTVTWVTADGAAAAPTAPEVTAATPGACAAAATDTFDSELSVLCDVQADGTSVSFIRRTTWAAADGAAGTAADFALDGATPYAPTGTVTECVQQLGNTFCYRAVNATADFAVGDILRWTVITTVNDINTPLFMSWQNLSQSPAPFFVQNGTNAPIGTFPTIGTDVVPCETQAPAADQTYVTESVVLGCVNGNPAKQVTVKIWNGSTFQSEQVGVFDGNGAPVAGPFITGPCPITTDPEIDIVQTVWCVNGVALVRSDTVDNSTGTITATAWTNAAGVVAAPTAPQIAAAIPGPCNLDDQNLNETVWCVNNAPLVRRSTINQETGNVTVTWFNSGGAAVVPTAPQIAAAVPGPCVTATTPPTPTVLTSKTFLIGGPTAIAGSSPDGATIDLAAWGATGGAVLDSYEIVVVQGDAVATAASANRVRIQEQDTRFLSQGMSVSTDSSDGDTDNATIASPVVVTAFGSSRVLIHAARRV